MLRHALVSLLLICGPASGQGMLDTLIPELRQARADSSARGVDLEAGFTFDHVRNLGGGFRRGAVTPGNVDLMVSVDGLRAFGIPGLRLHVHGLRAFGGDPEALVGDAQGVSSIYAPTGWRLFEAWVQQNFAAQQTSLMLGRFDLNAEFYHLNSASLFMNGSFGIGPEFSQTGRGGPSLFPQTAFGLRVDRRFSPFVVRAALMDGVPTAVPRADGSTGLRRPGDGLLWVAEAALLLPGYIPEASPARGRRQRLGRAAADLQRDTKLALGAWHYTGSFDDLLARSGEAGIQGPLQHSGTSGAWLIGEQVLHREAPNGGRRLTGLAMLGFADSKVNQFGRFFGAGLTLAAPFRNRPDDEIGVAIAKAYNGAEWLEASRLDGKPATDAETVYELSWLLQVTPWLGLQPAFQYVRNPGTDPGLRDARVLMLRMQIAL